MDVLCCFLFLVFLSVWCCPFQFWTFYSLYLAARSAWEESLPILCFNTFILTQRTENSEPYVTKSLMSFFFFYFCSLNSPPSHVSWQKIYIHSSVLILRPQKTFFLCQIFQFHLKILFGTWFSLPWCNHLENKDCILLILSWNAYRHCWTCSWFSVN